MRQAIGVQQAVGLEQRKPPVEPASMEPLYPLRFEPIYQYRLWGGRRMAPLLGASLPGEGPVGESWLICDRPEHSSLIANGPLQGWTLGDLLHRSPDQLLGSWPERPQRFPLLLKFLDVRGSLSVQVHPSDRHKTYLPPGESGKTEAWVVLGVGPDGRIYAGLSPHCSLQTMRDSLDQGKVADRLASFTPAVGDGIFIPAGTVHSLRDVVVFEVQENSDVTFRLYDWSHIDPKTRRTRPLQVAQALDCIDFSQGAIQAVTPVLEEETPVLRERLFDCSHFRLWRLCSTSVFTVGTEGELRILVCIGGEGHVHYDGADHGLREGDVLLLPAAVGRCRCEPHESITLLEVALPERD